MSVENRHAWGLLGSPGRFLLALEIGPNTCDTLPDTHSPHGSVVLFVALLIFIFVFSPSDKNKKTKEGKGLMCVEATEP